MGKSLWKPREDKNSAKVNPGSRTEESLPNKYSEYHMYLEIQHDLERNRTSWKLSTWAFTNMRIFKLKQWYFNKFFLLFFFFYIPGECIFLFLAIRVKVLKHHFLQIIKHFISCSLLNGNMSIFCSVYIILKVLFYLSGFFTFSSPF